MEYATEYYDFIRCEGQYDNRFVTMYIPITPSENENFVILFETFNGTKEKENAYAMQEPIIKTLILQPYFYEVKEGDSLMSIAKQLTDDSGNYLKIAQYKPNRKGDKALDPNQIYPGQRIGIPLNLLFEKKHYR